ncbi:hypothetical protein BJF79_08780 [Actinomadura sp. CNU-125]|uniref:hypothetical protein n=1 Tax=Actinomadura sp. CNU-125 TaxID=1904961 RepID=UPI00096277ED|nr:hypothetical protein [Actinomadura sp. CNU-125]OLT31879.1 hypothetical protein BJF79_08780 [Actinomadura sp. CNU-125]
MADAGPEEYAEFAATILDTFQELFEETGHLQHRTNDAHAHELISDLLVDLMHYADRRGLDFDDILGDSQAYFLTEQQQANVFAIGTAVQLEGPTAKEAILLGRPTRGAVTGMFVPDHGIPEYHVHFIGDRSSESVVAADLEPAPPFPPTTTTAGVIDFPLRAERALLDATTRIALADVQNVRPSTDDVRDHRALLASFASWTGMEPRSITDLLLSRISERLPAPEPQRPRDDLSPGRLAAQGFPTPITQRLKEGVRGPSEAGAKPAPHPRRQGPSR